MRTMILALAALAAVVLVTDGASAAKRHRQHAQGPSQGGEGGWHDTINGWRYKATRKPGGRLTVVTDTGGGNLVRGTGTWRNEGGKVCMHFDRSGFDTCR